LKTKKILFYSHFFKPETGTASVSADYLKYLIVQSIRDFIKNFRVYRKHILSLLIGAKHIIFVPIYKDKNERKI